MLRSINQWLARNAERRRSMRRAAADAGRWGFAPDYRHSAFGKPRFGRFDTFLNPTRWLRRVIYAAVAVASVWVLWESWRGLEIFGS